MSRAISNASMAGASCPSSACRQPLPPVSFKQPLFVAIQKVPAARQKFELRQGPGADADDLFELRETRLNLIDRHAGVDEFRQAPRAGDFLKIEEWQPADVTD